MSCKCIPWFKINHQLYTMSISRTLQLQLHIYTEITLHQQLWTLSECFTWSVLFTWFLRDWTDWRTDRKASTTTEKSSLFFSSWGVKRIIVFHHSARSHPQYQSRDTVFFKLIFLSKVHIMDDGTLKTPTPKRRLYWSFLLGVVKQFCRFWI